MSEPSTETSDAWRQVLALYAHEGVAGACLQLQDHLELDVLVMLHLGYVCWRHGLRLPLERIEMADAAVRDWREQVVRPLRAARRAIAKEEPNTKALRQRILQAELGAEQHAFGLLDALPVWRDDGSATASDGSPTAAVARFYAQRSGREAELQTPEIAQAIERLERAWTEVLA